MANPATIREIRGCKTPGFVQLRRGKNPILLRFLLRSTGPASPLAMPGQGYSAPGFTWDYPWPYRPRLNYKDNGGIILAYTKSHTNNVIRDKRRI